MHASDSPRLVIPMISVSYVVKRRHLTRVDWTRAVAKSMAASRELRTQTALAKRSGVAQSTIGRILRGEVNPQSGNLERIARALGMSLAQLAEIGQEGDPSVEPTADLQSIERAAYVPLISWSQAASLASELDIFLAGKCAEWMPRPKDSGAGVFALRVKGESMEPGYQHGDILFLDPDAKPEDGRDVLVRFKERDDVVLRRIMVEGKRQYLKPVNPSLPDKSIEISADLDAQIIGIVIGKWVEK